MSLSLCTDNCTLEAKATSSVVDILVKQWGYIDLLPENQPIFDHVPYHVHIFIGTLLTILGVLGCGVCIGLLYIHHRLSRYLIDPSGIFIINFLITNLFVVLTQVPFSAISSFAGGWIFGDFVCQFYAGIGFIVGLASIFALMLLVFDLSMHVINCSYSAKYFKLTMKNRGSLNIKLICIQWVISMALTIPPMFAILGRMHLEPSATMCTIDYWHGNFKNYKVYLLILTSLGFILPLSLAMTFYFKVLKILRNYQVSASSSKLTELDLFHILGMAKLVGLGLLIVIFSWGPFAVLTSFTFFASAKDLNIFMTMVPPIMAKFAPFLNGMALIFTLPRITAAFDWLRNNPTMFNVPDEITNAPKPIWIETD